MQIRGVLVVFAVVAVSALAYEPVGFSEDVRQSSSRIVAGWEAKEGQFPFQLSLRMVNPLGRVNGCGGSIIHPEWALSAAHCTAGRETLVVRAGGVNLSKPYLIFETTSYYNNPLYDANQPLVVQPHDISLIAFERTLQFNEYIQPIRLQNSESKNDNYLGAKLVASGWGRLFTNSISPEILNWVYLRGESNLNCQQIYGAVIQPSTICTRGYNDTSQGTCQGDSGGPLTVVDEDGEISQIGVTSFVFGLGCHMDRPAGFIRPGHYHDWFTEVTGQNFDWSLEQVTEEPEPTEKPEPTAEPETTEEPEPTEAPEDTWDSERDEEVSVVHFVNN